MAEAILLDTTVIVDIERGRGDDWRKQVEDKIPAVSFVTPAELWRGAFERGYGERKQGDLRAIIDTLLVVPASAALAQEWGRVVAEARTLGQPLGATALTKAQHAHDAWIAATGRLYELPLLTDNKRHFEGLSGLVLI